MNEAGQTLASVTNVRNLSDAVREMKNAAADRADVVVELREASRTRLELLAQELEPVFAEVPKEDPAFDLVISSGEQPRLWIDAVAHVVMGRDRRTYRFLRDTRLGRVVIAESADIKPVADQVTRYIAERMVERQRAVEGDVEILPRAAAAEVDATPAPRGSAWGAFFSGLGLVLLGGVFGVAVVAIAMWDRFPELETLLSRF
ncbi:hypothetical protein [Nitratireductor pacificus]|uniref:Uncharacterized protein n=1 Tax=Nitratireductor pacificus pht-3B TaxID=391937 RepID=K2MZG1_9HYPH|nr:hypothetical protein [Nitratireductor pacificus]EKF17408.1 hypothetical protein NA2_17886 [Nitratireductor pacificus pht-3B]